MTILTGRMMMGRASAGLLVIAAAIAGCTALQQHPGAGDDAPSTSKPSTPQCTPPTPSVAAYVPAPMSTDSMSAYTTAVMAAQSAASMESAEKAAAYSRCLAGGELSY
jgi:hypothetical protein